MSVDTRSPRRPRSYIFLYMTVCMHVWLTLYCFKAWPSLLEYQRLSFITDCIRIDHIRMWPEVLVTRAARINTMKVHKVRHQSTSLKNKSTNKPLTCSHCYVNRLLVVQQHVFLRNDTVLTSPATLHPSKMLAGLKM